jgi:hypothetical protein
MPIDYTDEFAAYVILEAVRRIGPAATDELVVELDRQHKERAAFEPWPWRDDGWPVIPSPALLDSNGRRLEGLDGVFDGERWIAGRGWTPATDQIVETWIGKRVELSTEAGASASGELLGVDATDLHMDLRPRYPEPQEIIRSNWRVRLAAEVAK